MVAWRSAWIVSAWVALIGAALHAAGAAAQQPRGRLVRIGDIAFGALFEDARESSDASVGLRIATGDRRELKTLAQTNVALFGAAFNLTYVFGDQDRLTRVFGSHVRAMDLSRGDCRARGADLFAASVHEFGAPDIDRSQESGREWQFAFSDRRALRFKFQFGGVLQSCSIIVEAFTAEGRNDRS